MINKIKLNQKFYIVDRIHKYLDRSSLIEGSNEKDLVKYEWIIPVYIKSINQCVDGEERFSICPVEYKGDPNYYWKWSRESCYDELVDHDKLSNIKLDSINYSLVFEDYDTAKKYYDKVLSPEIRKKYQDIHNYLKITGMID